MTRSLLRALPFVFLAACGAAPSRPAHAPQAAIAPPAPAVLTHSLYSTSPSGGLAEGDLQTVLSSPIDLQLPARLGVVPLAEPFDPKKPATLSTRHLAAQGLAAGVAESKWWSQVSDVSTDLPSPGGIEGLRVIAARYRVRYLLLFSQRFEDATHLNGWAWLYPTVLGMFVAPGVTVESRGVVQADLLDVRTGTILFTAVEPVHVHEKALMIGAARTHGEAQGEAAAGAAKLLAKRVVAQTEALVQFADMGAQSTPKTKLLPAPIVVK